MASTSVNRPTNPEQRDRDIENKLRLYGIYNAFKHGKLPSNKQIDVALTSFTDHSKLRRPNENLSQEGRVILNDFREVVTEAKRLLLTKNYDEALQEFIWHSTQLGSKGGPDSSTPNAPVSRTAAEQDRQRAAQGLKTLGELIITNGEFRKLLKDATVLLRDVASDAATKTAQKIGPTAEELDNVDRPAPENQWHEKPDLSRDNLKNKFRSEYERNKPMTRDDMRDVAGNVTQAADPHGSRDPRDIADRARQEQKYGTNSGIDVEGGYRTGVEDVRHRIEENVPEERKHQYREYRDRTKDYWGRKMPQERREQATWRLKKMIVEVQSHRDYQEAIDTLLHLAETYTGHAKGVTKDSSGTVKDARRDPHLRTVEQNLRVLIERFANYTSLDDLMEAINDIYRDADQDAQLKNWFRSVDRFLRRCLKEEGYLMRDESTDDSNRLYEEGNFLLRNRYREHTDRLMEEFKFIFDQFASDPDNKRFGSAMTKLFNDLGTDDNGKPVFKKHLAKDVMGVIIPEIFESVRYVPLPRIEYSDPMIDAVVENLVIESDNLMPNVFEIAGDTYFRWGRKGVENKHNQKFMVSVGQIQCDLRDVSYYIKRKQGFPKITDTGVADIFLGGNGLSFKLQLATADKKDRAHFFKVENVSVKLSGMRIKLKQSKHKAMFNAAKGILLGMMRPALTRVLEKQIRQTFADFDALAYRIYLEEQKAEEELKRNPDPENAKNIYQRYYEAAQRELTRRKARAEEKTKDKHVNVATTQKDSMFKNISLPGGISTRATELKEQAGHGEGWRNDLFSIGSAHPSVHISSPTQVTRKSPFAGRRTVRGREGENKVNGSRDSGFHGDGYTHGTHGYSTTAAPATAQVGGY